jgi:hypothetical protein
LFKLKRSGLRPDKGTAIFDGRCQNTYEIFVDRWLLSALQARKSFVSALYSNQAIVTPLRSENGANPANSSVVELDSKSGQIISCQFSRLLEMLMLIICHHSDHKPPKAVK